MMLAKEISLKMDPPVAEGTTTGGMTAQAPEQPDTTTKVETPEAKPVIEGTDISRKETLQIKRLSEPLSTEEAKELGDIEKEEYAYASISEENERRKRI